MTALSKPFKDLEKRFQDLSNKFVADQLQSERDDPFTFPVDLDRLAAFRLLVHAEVEDYLERKARAGVDTLESVLNTGWHPGNLASFFAISSMLGHSIPFESLYDANAFETRARLLLKAAREWVDKNNGVKSDSFIRLSILSGKGVHEIDSALASSLSTFGSSRGDVAHKSVVRTTTLSAPSAEFSAVQEIIKGLKIYFYGPPPWD